MRVMTWNIWWHFGDWPARRRAIRDVLTESAPDLLGLQEVWADPDENMAAWLADALDMHWAWAPTREPEHWRGRLAGATGDCGVALLSRWPIEDPRTYELPSHDGRTALTATVVAPHARVPFVAAHMSASDDEGVRRDELDLLSGLVTSASGGAHPVVFTADLNARPCSFIAAELREHLIDGWQAANGDESGYTWWRDTDEVCGNDGVRIDYVSVGPPVGTTGRVQAARLAGLRRVDGVWPSDHAAVIVDLSE